MDEQGSVNVNQNPESPQQFPQESTPFSSPPPEAPPSSNRKIVRVILIVFSTLFFVAVGVLGFVAYQQNQTTPEGVTPTPTQTVKEEIITKTPIPTQGQSATPSGSMEEAIGGNGIVFTSDEKGIRFAYLPEVDNQQIFTFETEKKVYVYYDQIQPQDGQFVEVFDKPANQTIEDAIKERFLIGRSEEECFVEVLKGTNNADSTITKLQISYPDVENGDFEGMIAQMNYCAPDYARTNGIRYFWYDSNHPTKYLFFDIGQYAIMAGNEVPWQDTIEIIK